MADTARPVELTQGMKTLQSSESTGVETLCDGSQHASDIVSLGGSGMMGVLVGHPQIAALS